MSRILVIDDTTDHRTIFAQTLRLANHVVAEADGGESGLTQYVQAVSEDAPFDLIVCDLGMPFMNGYEVAQRIRAIGDNSVPILFLSAHFTDDRENVNTERTDELNRRMEELGRCYFLAKPVHVTRLIGFVEQILQAVASDTESKVREA